MPNERLSIENEKVALSYIINHDNIEKFKDINGDFFQYDLTKDLYKSIEETNSTTPLVLQDYLLKKDKNYNIEEIDNIVSKNGATEDWVSDIYLPWKKNVFVNDAYIKLKKMILNQELDKVVDMLSIDVLEDIDLGEDEVSDISKTPTIDDNVFKILPPILKGIFEDLSDDNKRYRDVIFTSVLPVLSVLFPNVRTIWNGEIDRPNLYSFITAPAASGKGKMVLSRELLHEYLNVEKLDNEIRKNDVELHNSNLQKGGIKQEFVPKYTLIPGNSSSAAFYQKLKNNDGRCLLFVQEADEIIGNKKTEWGNYDGFLRLGFHNEKISRNRVDEDISYIDEPYICTTMSGTPDQFMSMFSNKSENGLFSRMVFYTFSSEQGWVRRFDENDNFSYTQIMRDYSKDIYKVYRYYCDKEVKVVINKKLSEYMDNTFELMKKKYIGSFSEEIESSVHRIAVITRKIIMLFTMFRYFKDEGMTDIVNVETNDGIDDLFKEMSKDDSFKSMSKSFGEPKTIFNMNDDDYESSFSNTIEYGEKMELKAVDLDVYNAVSLAKTYFEHTKLLFSSFSYNNMGKKSTIIKGNKTEELFNTLPIDFETKEVLKKGKKLGVSESTIKRYIKKGIDNGLIEKTKHGQYKKVNKKITTDE